MGLSFCSVLFCSTHLTLRGAKDAKKRLISLNWQHQYPRGPELEEGMWKELRSMYTSAAKTALKGRPSKSAPKKTNVQKKKTA